MNSGHRAELRNGQSTAIIPILGVEQRVASGKTSADKDAVEVSVGSDGAKVAVAGDGADRWANTLADALSPFSEAAGALGDAIRAYRTENVIRTLARAREIAAQHGVNLSPVPPKFLVQWSEGASLEEPGPDDLSDLWANLLVSSVSGVAPTHLVFKRILSEMTGRHLELLKWVGAFDEVSQSFNFEALNANAKPWNEFFGRNGARIHHIDNTESRSLLGLAEQVNSCGVRLVSIKYGPGGQHLWHVSSVDGERVHNQASPFVDDHSLDYLRLVGLLEEATGICRILLPDNARYAMEIKAWHITDLGLEFLRVCTRAAKGN